MNALSLVYPVQNLINSVAVGFGVGINAVIAICLGAGKAKEANKAATQGLFLNTIHGIIFTIVGLMIMPSFWQCLQKIRLLSEWDYNIQPLH